MAGAHDCTVSERNLKVLARARQGGVVLGSGPGCLVPTRQHLAADLHSQPQVVVVAGCYRPWVLIGTAALVDM
jgi:hypothetical protein